MSKTDLNSILIIDDEPNNIIALTEILEDDYTVCAVVDSTEAVETVEEDMPDVILLDVLMPGMDGYDVITSLKSSDKTRNIPVIFITGLDSLDAEAKGFALGAADYISKPFHPAIVKMRVKNQIHLLERLRLLEKENEKIFFDGLTNMYNRRFFDESITRIIKSLSRSKSIISLMMIDIDFFKQYNDTYGHSAGDECIITIADTLRQSIPRADDFVARYGGEEFVVVLPNTNESGACIVAERLLGNVQNCGILHEKSTVADHVTISIGITTGFVEFSHTAEDLIKRADEMLYKSKQSGRNKYSYESF